MQTAEQRREYFRRYDAARSEDPEYRARKAAKGRAHYEKRRADGRYEHDKARSREYARRKRAEINGDPAAWLRVHLKAVKTRARARGLTFSITSEDLETPEMCPVFGWRLNYGSYQGDHCGASIDRQDNSRGYEPGNVRIVCWRANNLRSDCDDPAIFQALAIDAQRLKGS